MESKKNRTLELYLEAGAWLRLAKAVLSRADVALSKVMPDSKTYRMHTARRILDELSSNCEDRMFFEHDVIGNEFTQVFYGAPNVERGDIDKEQIERMKIFVEGLFEK